MATAAAGETAVQREQRADIEELSEDLEKSEKNIERILLPVALLIGILALGGGLGVVFSIRDQRRVSQLHELTVGGEVMSQRRAEQTYASFFEQSQTTLSLVNDTLELAKEANERATQNMKRRAEEQVGAIGEKAEDLLQRIFREGDFEKVVTDRDYRTALHVIGDELRAVVGLLRLQEIKLPRNLKFIRGIDQFLLDDTEGALQSLRQISHEGSTGDLHHFILFWLGYMQTTVGEYEDAVRIFTEDEVGLSNDDTERFQLECIIVETKFFDQAKRLREQSSSRGSEEADHDAPLSRFIAVAPLLDRLTKLAFEVALSEDHRERHHVSLEVARTRADIYVWVAFEPDRLHQPLGADARAEFGAEGAPDLSGPPKELIRGDVDQLDRDYSSAMEKGSEKVTEAVRFSRSEVARSLSNDGLRAWSLTQAAAICENQHDRNFDVEFALGECRFMIEHEEAEATIRGAAKAIRNELTDLLEQRRTTSLWQCELLCHRRLLHLTGDEQEARQVDSVAKGAIEAANKMRQSRVTVFSQIERRNVTRPEFMEEVERIAGEDPQLDADGSSAA
jgi:hypothetical protein